MLVIFSVGMFNGIQRATSDLRPATSFHLVLVKLAPAFKTGLSVVFQTRNVRLRARAPPEQLSSSTSRRYLLSQLEHAQSQLFLLPEFRRDVWELSTLLMTLCVDVVRETESSILGFCIMPFSMLVIALTLWLQPQVSVLSARMDASCSSFSTACVSWNDSLELRLDHPFNPCPFFLSCFVRRIECVLDRFNSDPLRKIEVTLSTAWVQKRNGA